MAEPLGADKNAPSFKWYLRPIPLMGAGAVAIALPAVFGIWLGYSYRSGDAKAIPQRWHTLLNEDDHLENKDAIRSHNCYKMLTDKENIKRLQQHHTLKSKSPDDCFHFDDETIDLRLTDWLQPHVAVYSTPAPLN